MAKKTSDREDLLREATALAHRVELLPEDDQESAVIGFRQNGAASFFLHPQLVYHFTSSAELRRAYVNDRLIKAEQWKLVSLQRKRTEGEVQLLRHEMTDSEISEFLSTMIGYLETLSQTIRDCRFDVIGQEPEDADVVGQVQAWLDMHLDRITVAEKPNVA